MSMTESEVIRMTENEAVEMFRKLLDVPCEMIVKYDSVLTKDKYRDLVKIRCAEEMAISAIEEVQQYRAIGTVSEFRELKEKATAKKVVYRKQSYGTPWLCPNCEADQVKVEFMSKDGSETKKKQSFCWNCGCCIDWSEGKE